MLKRLAITLVLLVAPLALSAQFPTPQLGVLSRYLTHFPDSSVDAYYSVVMTAGPNPPEIYAPIPGSVLMSIAHANGHTVAYPTDVCQAIQQGLGSAYAGLSIVPAMPAPTITADTVTHSSSPQTITIAGSGFTAQSLVTLTPTSGSPLTPTVTLVSASQLTVSVTLSAAGSWTLTVRNLDNQSATTTLIVK